MTFKKKKDQSVQQKQNPIDYKQREELSMKLASHM